MSGICGRVARPDLAVVERGHRCPSPGRPASSRAAAPQTAKNWPSVKVVSFGASMWMTPSSGVGVEPHEAAPCVTNGTVAVFSDAVERRADPDPVGDLPCRAVDEDRQVGVDVEGDLLGRWHGIPVDRLAELHGLRVRRASRPSGSERPRGRAARAPAPGRADRRSRAERAAASPRRRDRDQAETDRDGDHEAERLHAVGGLAHRYDHRTDAGSGRDR